MILPRIFRFASTTRFGRNFQAAAKANLLAMLLPILVLPILTRLFAADDFGVLAVFTATSAMFVAVSTWRFDFVVPNAISKRMAASLVVAGTAVLLSVTAILFCCVLIAITADVPWDAFRQMGWLSFLIPVYVLGLGIHALLSKWFVRLGDLTAVSRAIIYKSVSNVTVQLATGAAGLGSTGLVYAYVIAAWFGNGAMFRLAGQNLIANVRGLRLRNIRAAVKRHGRTASWSTVVSFVNSASLNAPVILLAFHFTPKEVGWYALIFRVVATPVGIMTTALGQSFWSEAADLVRAGKYTVLASLYRRTTFRLGLASLPVIAACLAAPFVVGPILGQDEWNGAGYVMLAMTPLFIGNIMLSATNHLVVLELNAYQLFADFLRIFLMFLAMIFSLCYSISFVMTVFLIALSSLFGHCSIFAIHILAHKKMIIHGLNNEMKK